jgi:hypothetical protein
MSQLVKYLTAITPLLAEIPLNWTAIIQLYTRLGATIDTIRVDDCNAVKYGIEFSDLIVIHGHSTYYEIRLTSQVFRIYPVDGYSPYVRKIITVPVTPSDISAALTCNPTFITKEEPYRMEDLALGFRIIAEIHCLSERLVKNNRCK